MTIKKTLFRSLLVWLAAAGWSMDAVGAQDLPPCGERPHVALSPWTDTSRWCIELALHDDSGVLAFTALVVGADGTLYAARPATGQILALDDTDGDGLPDHPRAVAENLTQPNGLAFYDDALYISGGSHLYRLRDGELTVLVDDLPAGGGFWTGGLTIGPDERLYVATGAPCDSCPPDDPTRGAILSFDLDGGDRQIVATGLRQPADVAWMNGALWTVDTLRDGLTDVQNGDELNRVVTGVNFGWPYCVGADNQPDMNADAFDCTQAAAPAMTFPSHSNPLALAPYTSDALPGLDGTLLVVLGGNHNNIYLEGYLLAAVAFDAENNPTGYEVLVPAAIPGGYRDSLIPNLINFDGLGIWPDRPLGVAVSPEGWIYFSVTGGRIYALRPL